MNKVNVNDDFISCLQGMDDDGDNVKKYRNYESLHLIN